MARLNRFISSLGALQKLIEDVSNDICTEQMSELRATPFWELFDSLIARKISPKELAKSSRSIVYVIGTYRPRAKAFLIEGNESQFTAEDVKSIFGINDGVRAIKRALYTQQPTKSPFWKRRLRGFKTLTQPVIRGAVIGAAKGRTHEDFQDFARLLCLYALATVFFPTSSTCLSWFYVNLVDDLESIKEFSWSKAIHGEIMKSIAKSWRNPTKVTGGVVALLYWFCEKSHIMNPINRNGRPIFLKWSLSKLGRAMKRQKNEPAFTHWKGENVAFSNTDVDTGNEGDGEEENGPKLEKVTLSPGGTILHFPIPRWSEGEEFIFHPGKSTEAGIAKSTAQHLAAIVERDQLQEKLHEQQVTLEELDAKCQMLEEDNSKLRQQKAFQEDFICGMRRGLGLLEDHNNELKRMLSQNHVKIDGKDVEETNIEIQHNYYLQDEASDKAQHVEKVDEGEHGSNSEYENDARKCDYEDRGLNSGNPQFSFKLKFWKPRMEYFDFVYDRKRPGKKRKLEEGTVAVVPIDVELHIRKDVSKTSRELVIPMWIKKQRVITERDIDTLKRMLSHAERDTIVWSARDDLRVNQVDIMRLMKAKDTSSCVIDSYADIITRKHSLQDRVSKSFFFPSTCLTMVKSKNPRLRQQLIDNKFLEVVKTYRYIHFPINTANRHWSLIVLDTEAEEMTYYNSLKPRKNMKDRYRDEAMQMKRYLDCLLQGLPDLGINVPKFIDKETPQQKEGSLDCAIIVCYLMEHIATQMPYQLKLSEGDVGQYRALMVHDFLNDGLRSRSIEDYNTREALGEHQEDVREGDDILEDFHVE